MNSHWVLWVTHAWAQKIIVRQQNRRKYVTYLTPTYHTIISEWAALSHTAIDSAVEEWRQRLRASVRAGGGHFEHTLK